MTINEFYSRTGIYPCAEEWPYIEATYNESSCLDKDEFCRCWRKANSDRCKMVGAAAKAIIRENEEIFSLQRIQKHLGESGNINQKKQWNLQKQASTAAM